MTAREEFQAGRLADAITAAVEHAKSKPGDTSERWFLCELLCFAGELDRVDKHLDLIAQQEPKAMPNVALFRQLLRAESARRQFYSEGRLPHFLTEPTSELQFRLEASVHLRSGNASAAADLFTRADQAHMPLTGTCDKKAFAEFRDLDDLTAGAFEVLTSTGKYYWVPMQSVRVLEFRPAKAARDLLWRQARMAVRNGPDGEVYLPALYAGSADAANPPARLGRVTEWQDGPVARGVGQRMYLVGDDARAIGEVSQLEFSTNA